MHMNAASHMLPFISVFYLLGCLAFAPTEEGHGHPSDTTLVTGTVAFAPLGMAGTGKGIRMLYGFCFAHLPLLMSEDGESVTQISSSQKEPPWTPLGAASQLPPRELAGSGPRCVVLCNGF